MYLASLLLSHCDSFFGLRYQAFSILHHLEIPIPSVRFFVVSRVSCFCPLMSGSLPCLLDMMGTLPGTDLGSFHGPSK